jgi:hypothetical protein
LTFALKLFGGLTAATVAGAIGLYAYQSSKEGENAQAANASVEGTVNFQSYSLPVRHGAIVCIQLLASANAAQPSIPSLSD